MRVKFLTMPVFGAESHSTALSRALGLRGEGTAQHSSALRHLSGEGGSSARTGSITPAASHQSAVNPSPLLVLMVQTREAGTSIRILSVCAGVGEARPAQALPFQPSWLVEPREQSEFAFDLLFFLFPCRPPNSTEQRQIGIMKTILTME